MWSYSALRSIYTLKGTLCGAVRPTLKQTLKDQHAFVLTEAADQILSGPVTLYHKPTSLFPFTLSLHASPAPSFIPPSSVSLFYIPVSFPPVRPTLPHGVGGWRPVLTASYLTFSPLLRSNSRAKPKAAGLLRRWLQAALVSEVDFTFKRQATMDWCI